MSSGFISGARLRMTYVSAEGVGQENFFIVHAFALIIRSNRMLKHFNRRQISPMIRVVRLEINTSLDSDELHDPWCVRLQYMRILSCIHQSSEEEVKNVDWPRHAEVVEDANDFFSSGFISLNGAEGLRQ